MRKKAGGFILWTSMKDALLSLDDEALRKMVQAIFEYHETGKEPEFQNGLRMSWLLMKKQFDANITAYEEKCEKMRENIRRRWENERGNGGMTQKNTSVSDEYKSIQIGSNNNINHNIKKKVSKDTTEKKDFFLLYASEEMKKSEKLKELWEGWIKDRSERRKPVTVRAAKGQWDILNAQTEDEACRMVQESINRAYWTFYPKNDTKKEGGESHAQTDVCRRYRVFDGSGQDGN